MRFYFILTLSLLFLTNCSTSGDFERPSASPLTKLAGEQIDHLRTLRTPKSDFSQTGPEQDLHLASAHFQAPNPISYSKFNAHALTRGQAPLFKTDLASYLTENGYLNAKGRAELLKHYIQADVGWLMRLSRSMRTVIDHDKMRYETLMTRDQYTQTDQENTLIRIKENRSVLKGVLRRVEARIGNYDAAISRSKLEVPSSLMEEIEISLSLMRERSALLRSMYQNYIYTTAEK